MEIELKTNLEVSSSQVNTFMNFSTVIHYVHGVQVKQDKNTLGSPGNFSALPTNPRDWIVMDALPEQLNNWQANALYIIGDKPVLQDIPEDLYPNCTFVPVEVREGERERESETDKERGRGRERGGRYPAYKVPLPKCMTFCSVQIYHDI